MLLTLHVPEEGAEHFDPINLCQAERWAPGTWEGMRQVSLKEPPAWCRRDGGMRKTMVNQHGLCVSQWLRGMRGRKGRGRCKRTDLLGREDSGRSSGKMPERVFKDEWKLVRQVLGEGLCR